MQSTHRLSLITAAIALATTLLPSPPAMSQTLPPLPIQLNLETEENLGRPGGRRRGGGSRGGCQADIPLTAIAYAESYPVEELGITRTEETVGGLTTQATPKLWFYLPEPLTDDTTAELVVKGALDQVLYQGQVAGETDRSGIIGIPVAVSLETGMDYRWFFTLNCDGGDSSTVSGWLEHRSPNANQIRTLNEANPHNRAALYANYGFLPDALSELAMQRIANPEDDTAATAWIDFLSALDLSDLTAAPLLECCELASDPPSEPAPEEIEEAAPPEPAPAEETDTPTPASSDTEEESDSRTILQRARDRS